MKTYFISGHRNITPEEFEDHYAKRIKRAVEEGSKFVVGDYHGVDAIAQELLKKLGAQLVTVYHMFTDPRNNAGFKTRGGFTTDDKRDWAMTFVSDEDILWVRKRADNSKSGTQLNEEHRRWISEYAWYNDFYFVRLAAESLEGLNRLIDERHTAGYVRKEKLREFYVRGFLSLDSCGNCLKLSDLTAFDFRKLPPVLTREEYWEEVKKLASDDPWLSFSYNGGNVPSVGLKCAYCDTGWTLENCHDVTVKHREVYDMSSDGFAGKTLGEVNEILSLRTDGVYRLHHCYPIRNDQFIDLSPRWPEEKAEWAKKVYKNEKGWLGDSNGHKLGDDFPVSPTDELSLNVWEYYHRACNEERLAKDEAEKFQEVFQKAGFQKFVLTPVHNEYCPNPSTCTSCAPWYVVDTEIGSIKVGWRKRVINIDWGNLKAERKLRSFFLKTNISSLFKSEDVTVGDTYVHAWGWDKATEYLSKIRKALI